MSTDGTSAATTKLAQAVDAHTFFVRCTGDGTVNFTAKVTGSDDFSGSITCPGRLAGGVVTAPSGARVSLAITGSSDAAHGVLELIPITS